MKKRIFIGIFILIAAAVSININFQSQKTDLHLFSSANIEALAKDGENSSGKEKCKQEISYVADPMNGTRCSDRDKYSTYSKYSTTYKCVKGSGSNCKEGTISTGNDCNNKFDGSSNLRVVCP